MDKEIPKVIRRAEWSISVISVNPCESCGKWSEEHIWGLLDVNAMKILICSNSVK